MEDEGWKGDGGAGKKGRRLRSLRYRYCSYLKVGSRYKYLGLAGRDDGCILGSGEHQYLR